MNGHSLLSSVVAYILPSRTNSLHQSDTASVDCSRELSKNSHVHSIDPCCWPNVKLHSIVASELYRLYLYSIILTASAAKNLIVKFFKCLPLALLEFFGLSVNVGCLFQKIQVHFHTRIKIN